MIEIWKAIPGYEGIYEVSDLGRVKSLNYNNTKKEQIMIPSLNIRGYYQIGLSKNNKKSSFPIHQLVAMAFLNHVRCGYKLVVDHINDNKTDNRIENLQVITQRENAYKSQGKHTSKYKGVYWSKQLNKWRAAITINGKGKHLGVFLNEYDAHLEYQKALDEIKKGK